jgi:hypothetical protein
MDADAITCRYLCLLRQVCLTADLSKNPFCINAQAKSMIAKSASVCSATHYINPLGRLGAKMEVRNGPYFPCIPKRHHVKII